MRELKDELKSASADLRSSPLTASGTSCSPARSTPTLPNEAEERLRILSKLFTIYAVPRGEHEAKMRAYLEETRRIPPIALSHACHRCVVRPPPDIRQEAFLPPVARILREAALWMRETIVRAEGGGRVLDPAEIDVDAWLQRAPARIEKLEAERRAALERREIGAKPIEIDGGRDGRLAAAGGE